MAGHYFYTSRKIKQTKLDQSFEMVLAFVSFETRCVI